MPLVLVLIADKDIEVLDPAGIAALCSAFEEAYGLRIPPQPMMAIVGRAKSLGYVTVRDGKHVPVKSKIAGLGFDKVRQAQTALWTKTLASFRVFAEDMGSRLSDAQADRALLFLLKERDRDILMGSSDGSVLPALDEGDDHVFMASRFVAWAYEGDRESFDFAVSFATGHLLASAILNWNLEDYTGGLPGLYVYLDAPVVLQLAGITVPERQAATAEMLVLLQSLGVVLNVFEHSLQEAASSLDHAHEWVDSPRYDPLKAGQAARFLVDNGWTRSEVDEAIARLPLVVEAAGIIRRDVPRPDTMITHQIDEQALEKRIVADYRAANPHFSYARMKPTILLDIKSIASIFKLRKGRQATSLEDAKYVFVTCNGQLARISRHFEREEEGYGSRSIPCCVTDVFLGTLAWLASPANGQTSNVRRVVADCLAAMQPSPALVARMMAELKTMQTRNEIPMDLYNAVRVDPAARRELVELTQNDVSRFSAQTVTEMLQVYREQREREVLEEFEGERNAHRDTAADLAGYRTHIAKIARVVAAAVGAVVLVLCTIAFALAGWFGPVENGLRLVAVILGATGLGSVPFSARARGFVYKWTLAALTPRGRNV
jgi:hypothetical protein